MLTLTKRLFAPNTFSSSKQHGFDGRVSGIRMTHIQKLPIDLLLAILTYLDAPHQVAFAVTCHALFEVVGRRAFDIIELNAAARREFLALLERDLPPDRLYCPGCNILHRVPVTSSHLEPPALSEAPNYSDLWECVKFDRRNEVSEVYGPQFYFYQARMALRLYRLQHSNAEAYLQSLNLLQPRGLGGHHFFRRQVRVVHAQNFQGPSELAVRIQYWTLCSDKEITKDYHDLTSFTRLLVCFHMSYRGGVDKTGLRIAKKMTAATNAASTEAADEILANIRRAPLIGLSRYDVLTVNTKFSEFISYGTPNHCFTPLYRCTKCQTEHRTDVIRLAPFDGEQTSASPLSRGIAMLKGSKPQWAVVTTKWIRLGVLDAQDSWGWQGPAHVNIERELQNGPERSAVTGNAFASYEGYPYYVADGEPKARHGAHAYMPQWDRELIPR